MTCVNHSSSACIDAMLAIIVSQARAGHAFVNSQALQTVAGIANGTTDAALSAAGLARKLKSGASQHGSQDSCPGSYSERLATLQSL